MHAHPAQRGLVNSAGQQPRRSFRSDYLQAPSPLLNGQAVLKSRTGILYHGRSHTLQRTRCATRSALGPIPHRPALVVDGPVDGVCVGHATENARGAMPGRVTGSVALFWISPNRALTALISDVDAIAYVQM